MTCHILVGIENEPGVSDAIYHTMSVTKGCRSSNGCYKTPHKINREILEEVKAFLASSWSIPVDGYEHEFLSGGYLNIH